ncbi:hypothetical protein BDK51DRAFT_52615 [Blyttiomyces helicus]|uniref:Uncharacterized protein n=1 Tax=Blyttiomyces helicus TaxID=388810 RepID=A0A4P9WGL4_9FUNG|nr:hypothetical protein BDK51DRAFT_52615 [Blyttiomyces helicus]|eukprot:RKO90528.1 hypothetical protein BDK51DRAFT_52615 [Blyttiomyces helicus]
MDLDAATPVAGGSRAYCEGRSRAGDPVRARHRADVTDDVICSGHDPSDPLLPAILHGARAILHGARAILHGGARCVRQCPVPSPRPAPPVAAPAVRLAARHLLPSLIVAGLDGVHAARQLAAHFDSKGVHNTQMRYAAIATGSGVGRNARCSIQKSAVYHERGQVKWRKLQAEAVQLMGVLGWGECGASAAGTEADPTVVE